MAHVNWGELILAARPKKNTGMVGIGVMTPHPTGPCLPVGEAAGLRRLGHRLEDPLEADFDLVQDGTCPGARSVDLVVNRVEGRDSGTECVQ